MTRGNRAAAAASVWLLTFVTFASAQNAAVLSREQLQALVDESGTALRNLIAARDQKPATALAFKRDKRGKSPTDDLKQYVLPQETQLKLETLESGAARDLSAGDLPGAQIQLVELRQGLKAGIERFQAITEYWRESSSQPDTEGASRKATLKANGIDTPNQAEIETLSAQLDQQVGAGDFIAAMRTTWPKLAALRKQALNAESQQLLSRIDSDKLQGFRSATPGRKCEPAESGATSQSDTPNVRPDFPPSIQYFPISMKRQGIQSGTPEVFVVVDARGCPESAVLVGPAEHAEFDDAGLRLAVDGRYFPAQKDGKAVRSGMFLRVNFFNLL